MALIVYHRLKTLLQNEDIHKQTNAHPGLVFDRYINIWPDDFNFDGEWAKEKKDYFEKVTKLFSQQLEIASLLQDMHARRRRLASAHKGRILRARTVWRMVIGLGSGHPLETGFLWHRTLGVPYIPGSSVKGMMRAWADPKKGWGGIEESCQNRVFELFGDTEEHGCGRLILLDGLPIRKPEIEVDIINPHYAPYYRDPKNPPADYYSPNPVFFLAVAPEQEFEFIILPPLGRVDQATLKADLDEGEKLLREALETIGLGAKTAVGYGAFTVISEEAATLEDQLIQAEEIKPSSELPAPSVPLAPELAEELADLRRLKPAQCGERSKGELYKRFSAESDPDRKKQYAEMLRLCWLYSGDWEGRLSEKQEKKVAEVKRVLGLG